MADLQKNQSDGVEVPNVEAAPTQQLTSFVPGLLQPTSVADQLSDSVLYRYQGCTAVRKWKINAVASVQHIHSMSIYDMFKHALLGKGTVVMRELRVVIVGTSGKIGFCMHGESEQPDDLDDYYGRPNSDVVWVNAATAGNAFVRTFTVPRGYSNQVWPVDSRAEIVKISIDHENFRGLLAFNLTFDHSKSVTICPDF